MSVIKSQWTGTGIEKIFEKIILEKFPNLLKSTNLHTQKPQAVYIQRERERERKSHKVYPNQIVENQQ
jgi:hypothetical protein